MSIATLRDGGGPGYARLTPEQKAEREANRLKRNDLIIKLRDEEYMTFTLIAKRVGLSVCRVTHIYNAIKGYKSRRCFL